MYCLRDQAGVSLRTSGFPLMVAEDRFLNQMLTRRLTSRLSNAAHDHVPHGHMDNHFINNPIVSSELPRTAQSVIGKEASRSRMLRWILLALVFLLCSCSVRTDPSLHQSGGCAPSSSPFLKQDSRISGRISYCEQGDTFTGTIETAEYPAGTRRVELVLAGYPGNPGIVLSAVPTGAGAPIALQTPKPGEQWTTFVAAVPETLAKAPFRIRLEDRSTEPFGWAGLGGSNFSLATNLLQNGLPMLAALLLANSWLIALIFCLPTRDHQPTRIINGMLALGCAALTIVAAFVISTSIGKLVSASLLLLPFPVALVRGWRRNGIWTDLIGVQKALLPVLLLSVFVLWIGLFPFHWAGNTWEEPAARWLGLPMDAWLPLVFGNMLRDGRLDVPMIGDWLSSDRPPLQAGLYLLFYKLAPDSRGLVYQAVSTWAQALVLVPMNLLLARYMGRRGRALALFVLAMSPLVLLNSLFVWPKLLAAAFSIIYYLALFPRQGRAHDWQVAGIAAALAMLSHGGALFFLVAATLLHLIWNRGVGGAMFLRTGITAVLIYSPWIAYQRFIDPPGDRLIKWHFAGKIPVSDESAAHAIVSAYSQLSLGDWLAGRVANLGVLVRGAVSFFEDAVRAVIYHDQAAISHLVKASFYQTSYSLWFASPLWLIPCFALPFMLRNHRRFADSNLGALLTTVMLSLAIWVLMMFEPRSTIIHQGAYASILLLEAVVLVALYRCLKPLFFVVCVANVMIAAAAYAFDRYYFDNQVLYIGGVTLACTALAWTCWVTTNGDEYRWPMTERPSA